MPGDPAKAGFVFGGWYTVDGGLFTADGNLFTGATSVTGNIRVYAGWLTPIPDAHDDTLAGALAWIKDNAADWSAYTITVKTDQKINHQWLSYDGKRVSITIQGDTAGWEVTLSDKGPLFSVESDVTLNVENLTLKGRGNSADENIANDSALVQVYSGGVLKLKTGALITENYNSNNGGGGVVVNKNAAFTMVGGTIRANTAIHGGGVFVDENATFTKKGGTISSNTAANSGGGVHVYKGTFTRRAVQYTVTRPRTMAAGWQ
jgi:uncharacterized repeat protein (TIGR02543 family)